MVEQISGSAQNPLFVSKPQSGNESKLPTYSTLEDNSRGVIYANTTMRLNHMFVSLRIAMCQTLTGEKQLGQIRLKNQ